MRAHRLLLSSSYVVVLLALPVVVGCAGQPPTAAAPGGPTDHAMKPLAPVTCPSDAKMETSLEASKVEAIKADVIAWHCKKDQDCKEAKVIAAKALPAEADHMDELWTVSNKGSCYNYKVIGSKKSGQTGVSDP